MSYTREERNHSPYSTKIPTLLAANSESMIFLDFEKPLEKYYDQLEKLQQVDEEGIMDMSAAIKELEKKIKTERKKIYENLTGWQRVQLSRHPERPYTLFYIENICKKFVELHGDRYFKDDKAIIGGIGQIDNQSVVIIGHQKGVNTKLRQYRNFGMANPEGYRKAMRLMKMAEKFNFPIITLIDTPGAFPGIEAEERGQAESIARNLMEMAQLRVPIICYVIGEGASGGGHRHRTWRSGIYATEYMVLSDQPRVLLLDLMAYLGL